MTRLRLAEDLQLPIDACTHMTKRCNLCHRLLPVLMFNKSRRRFLGYHDRCRKCYKATRAVYQTTNRVPLNAFQQEYRDRTQKTVGRKIIESPSVYVSSQELDWAAGLFEGEGTITIGVRRSDETYRLICMVGNTDRQVVEFFHERWGGWFQPAYGKRPGRKPAWYWTVAGPRAETFVRTIQPHLRTSRVIKKAQLALQFRASQSRLTRVWNKPGYRVVQREI